MGRPKKKPGRPIYFREWRLARGLKQEQVADRARLSQETISRLESGKTEYTKANLEALAHAYGCEPGDLLRPPKSPPNELERYVMKMDAKAKAKALKVLKAHFDDDESEQVG
jgi:transcriptional regulator with XRE-family HTH domain